MEAHIEGRRQHNKLELLITAAEADLDAKEKKNKAWELKKRAMRIDDKRMKIHEKSSLMLGVVKMGFLAVIVGCELDLYAFIMSWPGYWNMPDKHHQIEGLPLPLGFGIVVEFTVIKLLLVVGPIGYFLACAIYLRRDEQEEEKSGVALHSGPTKNRAQNPLISEESASLLPLHTKGYATNPRKKVNLKYFHILPVLRCYLLIKDIDPDDIEGLFRVNALSTFTLGVAQIVCMLFHQCVAKAPWTIFIKVGIFTQCWNIGVTLLYFLTPACSRMMASISVDILKHNVEEDVMKLHKEYLDRVATHSEKPRHGAQGPVEELTQRIDREITMLGGLSQDPSKIAQLLEYDMEYKLEALGRLRRVQYLNYALICK